MHQAPARLFMIFGYSVTTLGALTVALMFVTLFDDISSSSVRNLDVKCEVASNTMSKDSEEAYINGEEDRAKLLCSFTADFRRLFNWNVKQLFVYLFVEYNFGESANQAILWDHIIERGDNPSLQAYDLPPKYFLRGYEVKQLRDSSNATVKLGWNVIRNVGLLEERGFQGTIIQIQIPNDKNQWKWKHNDING